MASGAKSIVLNREEDWKEKSVLFHISFDNDELVSENKTGENGVYISNCFDSGENETVWHRLRLNVDLPPTGSLKLRLYASDETSVIIPASGGKGMSRVNINEFISDKSVNINRKVDMFDYIGARLYENPNDVLMFDQVGRYLWVCIEIINYEQEKTIIKSMKIEFPRVSFVDYLPEIYKEGLNTDSFLSRYLGIFQNIYVDLEDRIDVTPTNFAPNTTTKGFLNWMAEWFSIKDAAIWGEKKLRMILRDSVKIYKMKGTKRAISKIVEAYTGIEPIIVEKFDIKENQYYQKHKSLMDELYGDNGFVFTVIISDKYVKSSEEYIELLRVINSVKPIDSICNLVVLNDKIYLDHHCYMGMNSYIAQNQNLVIGEGQQDLNTLMIAE